MYVLPPQITIHKQDRLIKKLGECKGKINGRERFALSRQSAGNHYCVAAFFFSEPEYLRPKHFIYVRFPGIRENRYATVIGKRTHIQFHLLFLFPQG